MYSIKELAKLLKVNPMTIQRHITSGEIKAVKIARKWRISEEEYQRILKEGL